MYTILIMYQYQPKVTILVHLFNQLMIFTQKEVDLGIKLVGLNKILKKQEKIKILTGL